ncbi:MAG: DNA topoisomerase IV subunit A, partial [Commensalibacter sp.]|nr:DNA topoisomerase IV subunit A [Commensalibacter sp.]
DPKSGFKKCARIVGDVIGKYHPHGDAAVYEALVRLAQNFAVRYPLVEGQGNFGSIDGDNAAAMRYTESRMSAIAQALLEGIDENAVDFRDTYDGEDHEPVVLPGAFPNLLANGASGIAVGMATNIPPHNAGEIYAAATYLIKKPNASTEDLLQFIHGPDFPTGGEIVEDHETILKTYETGRGSLRVRARWQVEQGRFGTWQIIVTEIPYQVQKSRLIEQIASLMEQKKLTLLADIRDESTDDVRLVLEPKSRGIEPEVLMESLFRVTNLETRFALNMNVLDAKGVPNIMGLKSIIKAWLDHRHEVLIRRSQHRLNALERRLEILQGLLAVYLNLDEVIRIIREEDEVKIVLMNTFHLTDLQAESILNMRLRSLRRLEEEAIRNEYKSLQEEQNDLLALLDNETLRWKKITQELNQGKKIFGNGPLGERRTIISSSPDPIDVSVIEAVEKEPLTVILSQKGWIKALKGHGIDLASQKFKEGDALQWTVECQSTDRICLFGSDGKSYNVKVSDLPRGRGDGQPIRLLVDLSNDDTILAMFALTDHGQHLLVSESSKGILVLDVNLVTERKAGKQILTLKDNEKALFCVPANGDQVAIANSEGRFLIFALTQIPEMKKGLGVILQKTTKGKPVLVKVFSSEEGLTLKEKSRLKDFKDLQEYVGNRASAGRKSPNWVRS